MLILHIVYLYNVLYKCTFIRPYNDNKELENTSLKPVPISTFTLLL